MTSDTGEAQIKKALISLKTKALGGAYGTRTRDPMRDRHVF